MQIKQLELAQIPKDVTEKFLKLDVEVAPVKERVVKDNELVDELIVKLLVLKKEIIQNKAIMVRFFQIIETVSEYLLIVQKSPALNKEINLFPEDINGQLQLLQV